LASIWAEVGLEFKPHRKPSCEGQGNCAYCQKPLLFQQLEERVKSEECLVADCPQMQQASAAN